MPGPSELVAAGTATAVTVTGRTAVRGTVVVGRTAATGAAVVGRTAVRGTAAAAGSRLLWRKLRVECGASEMVPPGSTGNKVMLIAAVESRAKVSSTSRHST
jgi:hypothetical protein